MLSLRLDVGVAMPRTIPAVGLEAVVSSRHNLSFRASVCEELAAIERATIDVLLLHLDLTGAEFSLWKSIRRRLPQLNYVLVAPSFTDRRVPAAARENALCFVSEAESPPSDILKAIDALARGDSFIPDPLSSILLRDLSARNAALSERERAILNLICCGLTDSEIAQQLILGRNSVKKLVKEVLKKLGARNRTAAAVTAITEGLAEPQTSLAIPIASREFDRAVRTSGLVRRIQ